MLLSRRKVAMKKRFSWQDAVIIYEIHGADGIDAAVARHEITSTMIQNASNHIRKKSPKTADALAKLAKKHRGTT